MPYFISYYCVSHQGLIRKQNQDQYLCNRQLRSQSRIGEYPKANSLLSGKIKSVQETVFAVFDGMSGMNAGEKASEIAAITFKEYSKWDQTPDCLKKACENANDAIFRYACDNAIGNMGTTVAGIRFGPTRIDICNVGDSRVYRYGGNKLCRVSEDHVLPFFIRGKPPMYQYLGMDSNEVSIEPKISSCQYSDNDIYLLCSDGLTDLVSEKEIAEILFQSREEEAVDMLLSRALSHGGTDNITIILLYIRRKADRMKEFMDISKIWQGWEIEKVLGRGSFGTVFKAVNKENPTEKPCAVKVISIPLNDSETDNLYYEGMTADNAKDYYKEVVDDFIKEIQLMDMLKDCQNVVRLIDYRVLEKKEQIGYDIFLRMELLTPLNVYTSGKKLSEEEVLKIGYDLCNALEICSMQNIIHRDIKPENVFVSEDGDFKIGDFGIAKQLEDSGASMSQKGTFNYMAPEIINSIDYDAKVDQYSLGILMYRLLNDNRLPFVDTEKQILSPNDRKTALERRLKGEALPAPKFASKEVSDIILKACAYEPKDRFKDAAECKAAIGEILYPVVEEEPPTENGPEGFEANNSVYSAGNRDIKLLAVFALIVILLGVSIIAFELGRKSELSKIAREIETTTETQITVRETVSETQMKTAETENLNAEEKASFASGEKTEESSEETIVKEEKDLKETTQEDTEIVLYDTETTEQYMKAKKLLEEEKYSEAKEIFLSLGDYLDASNMAKMSVLYYGRWLLKQGLYQEASPYLLSVVNDQVFLSWYCKGYAVPEISENERDYDGADSYIISRRYRYWNSGMVGIIVDYIDEDDIADRYIFGAGRDDDPSLAFGFFEYDRDGNYIESTIFTD